jgi:hypothetical protein
MLVGMQACRLTYTHALRWALQPEVCHLREFKFLQLEFVIGSTKQRTNPDNLTSLSGGNRHMILPNTFPNLDPQIPQLAHPTVVLR